MVNNKSLKKSPKVNKCMNGKSKGDVVVKSYVSKSGTKVKCHRRKSPKVSRKSPKVSRKSPKVSRKSPKVSRKSPKARKASRKM